MTSPPTNTNSVYSATNMDKLQRACRAVAALPISAQHTHPKWPIAEHVRKHAMLLSSLQPQDIRTPRTVLSTVGFPRPLHFELYGASSSSSSDASAAMIEVLAEGMHDYLSGAFDPCPASGDPFACSKKSSRRESPAGLSASDVLELASFLLQVVKESTATWCYRHDIPRQLHERPRAKPRLEVGFSAMRRDLQIKEAMWAQQHQQDEAPPIATPYSQSPQCDHVASPSWMDLRNLSGAKTEAASCVFIDVKQVPLRLEAIDIEEACRMVAVCNTTAT